MPARVNLRELVRNPDRILSSILIGQLCDPKIVEICGMSGHFDIVWFDPPYDVPTAVVEAQVATVVDRWLAPDGLVVLERSSRDTPPTWPGSLTAQRQRRYGETTLYLATREDDA